MSKEDGAIVPRREEATGSGAERGRGDFGEEGTVSSREGGHGG